jgi:hypothetical protein
MYSFGNFQQQEDVYIEQETTIFPEYLVLIPTFTKEETLGHIHYINCFRKFLVQIYSTLFILIIWEFKFAPMCLLPVSLLPLLSFLAYSCHELG